MHLGDGIIIFVIALILFGPKKLPEMARQFAKLMAEFRRASNEFKTQIDEELRSAEQADRQKQISAAAVATTASTAVTEPMILPPSTGAGVSHHAYSDQTYSEASSVPELSPTETSGQGLADADLAIVPASEDSSADSSRPDRSYPAHAVFDNDSSHNGATATTEAADATPPRRYGTLFDESEPSFGAPYSAEVAASSDSAALPIPDAASNGSAMTSVEGSAAENAQASLHG